MGRKRLKERISLITLYLNFRRKQMTTATYRGIQYNVKAELNELSIIKKRLEKVEKLYNAQLVMAGKKG